MPEIKTVQDLIDELNKIKDKSKPIFSYITNELGETFEVVPIRLVDDTISDRVDINIHIEETNFD
jgi:hypothetical protein